MTWPPRPRHLQSNMLPSPAPFEAGLFCTLGYAKSTVANTQLQQVVCCSAHRLS